MLKLTERHLCRHLVHASDLAQAEAILDQWRRDKLGKLPGTYTTCALVFPA